MNVDAVIAMVTESKHITDFQRKVYLTLMDVPCGETITYGELARRVGCRSAQAIGQALRRNPFAPDVPCHRVVAHNGIGGYFGQCDGMEVEKKRQLLETERQDRLWQQSMERPGGESNGSAH